MLDAQSWAHLESWGSGIGCWGLGIRGQGSEILKHEEREEREGWGSEIRYPNYADREITNWLKCVKLNPNDD